MEDIFFLGLHEATKSSCFVSICPRDGRQEQLSHQDNHDEHTGGEGEGDEDVKEVHLKFPLDGRQEGFLTWTTLTTMQREERVKRM